jgi:ribonuclease D
LSLFNPNSFVDIQQLAKLKNIENVGLKKLTEQLLNKKLSKRQQLSNWELPILSEAQIIYAATDAYACLLLYEKLLNYASLGSS